MSKLKIWLHTVIFSIMASFLLGIGTLFLIAVPTEAYLKLLETSQTLIDLTMVLLMVLWLLITVLTSLIFYKQITSVEKRIWLNGLITISLLILSSFTGYLLYSTENSVLAVFQGEQKEIQSGIVFGPYPDSRKLSELKAKGFTGVITLLHPIIPFEKVLLREELATGQKLDLKIHSFPMLPWVSSNNSSLREIVKLIKDQKGSYYVHCYLGKHRVDLVKQTLKETLDTRKQDEVFPLYPDHLERGHLYYYQNGKVILGPYPTDEEWFNFVLRSQVKEVISILDPAIPSNLPLIAKEKKMCTDMGLTFRQIPPQKGQADHLFAIWVVQAVTQSKHKVFLHGFKENEIYSLLDGYLRTSTPTNALAAVPQKLTGGSLRQVSSTLYLGPPPTTAESKLLQETGFLSVLGISKLNASQPILAVNHILEMLKAKKGPYYFHGFANAKLTAEVTALLHQRFYGMDAKLTPTKIGGEKTKMVTNRILLGGLPSPAELEQILISGVNSFIFVTERDAQLDAQKGELAKVLQLKGFSLQTLPYRHGYTAVITKEALKDNTNVYVIAPSQAQPQITEELLATKLN